ncbi:MAG: hypothetical protein CG446_1108, partial [Methanosaeta sp. ASO1]
PISMIKRNEQKWVKIEPLQFI